MLPLEGVRVVDLTNFLPGPFCSMILSDFGAEVIKVERPPKGDPARYQGGMFASAGRNKKSVALDLKSDGGTEALRKLVLDCDVLMEGFRPGVLDRLGFGWEAVRALNDRVVYCSISGFGQTGPNRDLAGHDVNYLTIAGARSISGDPDGPPVAGGGVQVADLTSAMYAAVSVLAAIINRGRTGKGAYLDVSMTDCVLAFMGPRILEYFDRGMPPKGTMMGRSGFGAYRTRDGKYVSVGCLELNFWQRLCDALGDPELGRDPKYLGWFDRMKYRAEINPRLDEKFLLRDRDEWMKILREADVPVTPVNRIEELENDPQFVSRGMIKRVNGQPLVAFPVKFEGLELREPGPAPELGADNGGILGGPGL